MALTYAQLDCVVPLIHDSRVLSLGYPDVLVYAEGSGLPEAPTGNIHGSTRPLVDTRAVFSALGAKSFDCVDYFPDPSRGERFVDLNHHLTKDESLERYDLVIDPGTTEHCANVWQAFVNAGHYVAEGGHVAHFLCTDGYLNHGFYQMQPTLFSDYYHENGWKVRLVGLEDRAKGEIMKLGKDLASSRPKKGEWSFGQYMVWVIAQRLPSATVGRIPVQTKYRRDR